MTDGGRIVLSSSVSVRLAVYQHALYAASKAAIPAVVRNLAPELAERNIAINAIALGATATRMATRYSANYTHPALADAPFDALIRSMSALGRLAQPAEIAAVAAFLLSPDASYITGTPSKPTAAGANTLMTAGTTSISQLGTAGLVAESSESAVALAAELVGERQRDEQSDLARVRVNKGWA
jgi:short-subunit dehydrogenase